jgi:hypothetical protein
MQSSLRRCALFASIAIVSLLALPVGAAYADDNDGHTIVVTSSNSIQSAIDHAAPGSTIVVDRGTYHENLTITKDHITLKSKRGLGSVVLDGRGTPTASICNAPGAVNGICVDGLNPDGTPGTPVTGTRIDGFVLDSFSGFGVILLNAIDSAVSNSEAKNNQGYGISGFGLSGIRFVKNIAHDNVHPGFYIGDSPNANAYVVGNRAFHNGVGGPEVPPTEGFGFLFRDSSHGLVKDNSASDNCAGFVFVDSSGNPTDELNDWRAVQNSARNNTRRCSGEAGFVPPTSGIGFALVGTKHVTLRENTARGNGITGAHPAESGGIVVISGGVVGGPVATDNLIVQNRAFGNSPLDIFWDQTPTNGGGNKFEDNHCKTSSPPGLCQRGGDD